MTIDSSSSASSASSELDERHLVEGLIAGAPGAVREFLDRTHHPVYCMAIRLSSDPETRRDWCHDTLLGILDDLRLGRFEYRGSGSFWGWFRKRAHYRLLDEYRRSRRISGRESPRGGPLELEDAEAVPGGLSRWSGWNGGDPHEELERVEMLSALETCLRALDNENHRKALELLWLQDQPYEEISLALEAPLNTVRAWIRRGRLAVRTCLTASLGLDEAAQLSGSEEPSSSRRRPEA